MLRCGDQGLEVTARLISQLETVTVGIPKFVAKLRIHGISGKNARKTFEFAKKGRAIRYAH
jgi:hypothetical protein